MFFNQDILFKNGPLALIWMAGNEEFKNRKGRRNKDYQALLRTNVVAACKDLRAQFPNMGTAYGLSLKKMGTLVKGLGVIYSIQVEELARDVYQATIALKRPATLANNQIDAPRNPKAKTTVGKGNQIDAAANNAAVDEGFGGLPGEGVPENFGQLNFGEQAFGTPRAVPSRLSDREERAAGRASRVLFTPPRGAAAEEEQGVENRHRRPRSAHKRRRDEDNEEAMHREVCRKLQSVINDNPDANCMREEDDHLAENNGTCHNEFDFGDGMDLLAGIPGPEAGGEMEGQPPQSPTAEPPDPTTSAMGAPSGLEFEDRSNQLQTPTGAGTRAENTRKRRNEGQEPDVTEMELGDVNNDSQQRSRIRAARKRLRLMVDSRTNFSLEDMLHRINTLRRDSTMDNLQRQLDMNRAQPKSKWKHIPGKIDNFLRSAGRAYPSRALDEMVQEILDNQLEKPEKVSFESDASLEVVRDAGDASHVVGISVSSVLPNGRSGTDTHLEPDPDPQGCAPVDQQEEYAGSPPRFAGMEDETGAGADQGFGNVGQFDGDMGPEPFQAPAEARRRRKSREPRNDEQSGLADRLDEFSIFANLFPLRQTTKRRAAMAFSLLLKMQAKKEVYLHEEESYGPIRIERLARLSQSK